MGRGKIPDVNYFELPSASKIQLYYCLHCPRRTPLSGKSWLLLQNLPEAIPEVVGKHFLQR